MAEEPTLEPTLEPIYASVKMTVYSWHALLKDLEELMTISNRYGETTRNLYEMIATQLNGKKVNVIVQGGTKTL